MLGLKQELSPKTSEPFARGECMCKPDKLIPEDYALSNLRERIYDHGENSENYCTQHAYGQTRKAD